MELTRGKVAAAAAAVVPFSCVICFEEFHSTTRQPVVLPCGHTFVCQPCSKRLKRCMECREPLFIPGKKAAVPTPTTSYRSGRYSPSTPPTPVQTSISPPVPLPIPKNLVLLSMMEAAERQTYKDNAAEEEAEIEEMSDDENETFDLDKVIGSISTISGPCGTYAVVERNGLIVLSKDPRKEHADDESSLTDEKKDDDSYREPMELKYGQKIQVVDFRDGVARLARGQGFVIASRSGQLAKVGGPIDEACRLEGIMETVSSRGKDLQAALDENALVEASLREKIADCHEGEPTFPVITCVPSAEDVLLSPAKEESPRQKAPSTPKARDPNHDLSQPLLFTPKKSAIVLAKQMSDDSMMEIDENGVAIYTPTPAFPGSPNSIDNADIRDPGMPSYRRTDPSHDFVSFGCGTSLLGGSADALWGEGLAAMESAALRATEPPSTRPRAASGSPRTLPIEQPLAPPASASFDGVGVNFRTGMSGHRALLSNKMSRKNHTPSREVRMMSAHRGIGMSRNQPHRKDSPNLSPSLEPRFEDY